MVERQKKIRDEFPRNVGEYIVDNLRDTRTRKVLYTYNSTVIIKITGYYMERINLCT